MGQLDPSRQMGCELCITEGGHMVASAFKLRVIRVLDPDYPGFYRVIWNDHVAEFTDLPTADRVYLMEVLAKVESLVREHLHPFKVNLASLGNVVPHLHWHVIARYDDDKHFPQPIWGTPQRAVDTSYWDRLRAELPALDTAIQAALHVKI